MTSCSSLGYILWFVIHKLLFRFGLPLLLLWSCSKNDDFDTQGFRPVQEQMIYATLQLSRDVDFLEYRRGYCGNYDNIAVLYTTGDGCTDPPDESCQEALDTAQPGPNGGFNKGCLPGCCDDYVVTESGGIVSVAGTLPDLLGLLGPIDSESDALLWVRANGYYYVYNETDRSAVREVTDGYRIIALRLVQDCAPIVVNRYLLQVGRDGSIVVLAESEDSRDEDACI